MPVQGGHLRKEAVVFGGLLILVMSVWGLHIDLDQLGNEAIPTGLSMPVQGGHHRKEAIVSRGLLILVMPVWGLHIDLDQLGNHAIS